MADRGEQRSGDAAEQRRRYPARQLRIRKGLFGNGETGGSEYVGAIRPGAGFLGSASGARQPRQRLEMPSRGRRVGRARIHSSGGPRKPRRAQQVATRSRAGPRNGSNGARTRPPVRPTRSSAASPRRRPAR